MPLRALLAAFVVVSIQGAASIALTPDSEREGLEFPLAWDRIQAAYETVKLEDWRRSEDLAGTWIVQPHWRTGFVHFAYGTGLSLAGAVRSESEAVAIARSFLVAHQDLLGTRADNMELRNVFAYRGKYAVHFRQVLGRIPVHRGGAFVVLGESGQVAAFGSDFFPDRGVIPAPALLSERDAVAAAINALGASPRDDRPIETRQTLEPVAAGEVPELRTVWVVTFECEEPLGKWQTWVHGQTGETLGRKNLYRFLNVTGNVDGPVEDVSYCDGETVHPLANLTVNVQGGSSADTDANGNFDIVHGGTTDVTVTAEMLGPYLEVNNFGANASFTGTATPGVPMQVTFDQSNSVRPERNVFYHGNLAHDFIKAIDPGFTSLDYPMPASVGVPCACQALWTGTGMSFCRQPGSQNCANTARFGDIIYHEYAHGVTQEWYIDNGATTPPSDVDEGNSDLFSNFLDRNSIVGLGAWKDECDIGFRDAKNQLQWPDDSDGGHWGGQILAGFHWDAWQSLLGTLPQAEADTIAWRTWHFGRGMGTPQNQGDQVLWTFVADDDDADLTNGTPNYDHFCLGASAHGFPCPQILTGVTIVHDRLAHTTDDLNGYDVVAEITSSSAALDPNELEVVYRVNGGPDVTIPMAPTGNPDEYSATIPEQTQHTEIEYWVSAMDLAGNSRTDPLVSPPNRHAFDVAMIVDDLEGGAVGWTTVDAADTGEWALVDPMGTQTTPENDATTGAGVNAWVTGTCVSPNCSGGCNLECNDVDNGTVSLITPVYDLLGAAEATIKYERWFSNNFSLDDPSSDLFVVDVSNDGGANWTNVESTNVALGLLWTTHSIDVVALFGAPDQVQVRFLVNDAAPETVVEAGVDDVRVLADFFIVDAVPVSLAARVLALDQNTPNPFLPSTRIEFAVPDPGEVRLSIYDVRGRAVRDLVRGPRDPGRHTVKWDGLDASGNRVAPGIYFYRLTAAGKSLTRKMTLLR